MPHCQHKQKLHLTYPSRKCFPHKFYSFLYRKPYAIYITIGLLTAFFCWLFVGRYGIFGSKVDWISQHSVLPDYFRQQFYQTGNPFPEFAPNIGGGQNIYNFSYYGLYSPIILVSYLLPFVKMGDYLMAASVCCLAAAAMLLYCWLAKRGFSMQIRFLVTIMYLLAGPMVFQSYGHIMFVNYMPFLCMAFLGIDSYFEKNHLALYTIGVFFMILSSFYFSIGGMLALVLYGLHRYFQINEDMHHTFLTFLRDGIYFLLPMLTAVLMSGILLLPTALALSGRTGAQGSHSLLSLLLPNIQAMRLTYNPYGIGLTTLLVTALLASLTYKKCHERILSYGCVLILTLPLFSWLLNGGLYIRDKSLIPFLPLLCYLIAYFLQKMENRQIPFPFALSAFLLAIPLLCLKPAQANYAKYGWLILMDALLMLAFFLLYWKKHTPKNCIFLLAAPPVMFLFLFQLALHPCANRIETPKAYAKATAISTQKAIAQALKKEKGFYRMEQLGTDTENAATLNRIWNMGQYISSLYSSSYNAGYQNFRENIFQLNEPFRNCLMQSPTHNPIFQKLMGIKYLISQQDIPGYAPIGQAGSQAICQTPSVAPIAYATGQIISKEAYDKLKFPYSQLAFLYAAVVDTKSAPRTNAPKPLQSPPIQRYAYLQNNLQKADTTEAILLKQIRQAASRIPFCLTQQTIANATWINKTDNGYQIQSKENQNIQIEIPSTELPKTAERLLFLQFKIKNNRPNKDAAIWLEGEGNKLTAQDHIYYNKNTTFTYAIPLKRSQTTATLTFGKGNYEITEIQCFLSDWQPSHTLSLSHRLYQSSFCLHPAKSQGNIISGALTAKAPGYFVTSIPYDPNFEVQVDGVKILPEKVNTSFLGFSLPKGRHAITITYHAPGFALGKCISATGFALFAGLLFFPAMPFRKKQKSTEKDNIPAYM